MLQAQQVSVVAQNYYKTCNTSALQALSYEVGTFVQYPCTWMPEDETLLLPFGFRS